MIFFSQNSIGTEYYLYACFPFSISISLFQASYNRQILSRKIETLTRKDFDAMNHIIKYLKLEKTSYKLQTINVSQFSDLLLTRIGQVNSYRKSTLEKLFKLGNNVLSQFKKILNCVALSSAEGEYITASSATAEITRLIKLL